MTAGLVLDSIATACIVVFMISMKIPDKAQLHSVFHNLTFWLYLLFWLKTVMLIIRVITEYVAGVEHEEFSLLAFNWIGCTIVTISTVVPFQWVYHFASAQSSIVQIPVHDRLRFCVCVLVAHVIAIVVSLILMHTGTVSFHWMLFVWRLFFFACTVTELIFLSWSLMLIHKIDQNQARWSKLKVHLLCTIYMRMGIAATIVLHLNKMLPYFPTTFIHLFFVLSSILGYRRYVVVHSQTVEQVLVCEDQDDSAVLLFQTIAARLGEEAKHVAMAIMPVIHDGPPAADQPRKQSVGMSVSVELPRRNETRKNSDAMARENARRGSDSVSARTNSEVHSVQPNSPP
eukprot:c9940_g1_i4.p1 GENE.c9940_g1_i4~~c9940_g1_i4.p1  ORF type:complete len:359 (+),score=67.68 c9940_g1_i4:47-1078(+)